MPPILLASASPRRHQLLHDAGFDFQVKAKPTDEAFPPGLAPERVPAFLAQAKAEAFDAEAETHLIITCDTVVILASEVINKPADAADARQMLRRLSGNRHSVVTGVHFRHKQLRHGFSETTEVYFRQLSDAEIEAYVQSQAPLDRAGAYGIQDSIGLRGIWRIEGDFYNVMGLPVCRLVQELVAFEEKLVIRPGRLSSSNPCSIKENS